MDRLISDNREWLRFCAELRGLTPLHIQNVIAWWQRYAVVSVLIRGNSRDLFCFVSSQNDQRIVGIVSRCHRRRVVIGKLDRAAGKNLQLSLKESLRRGIT